MKIIINVPNEVLEGPKDQKLMKLLTNPEVDYVSIRSLHPHPFVEYQVVGEKEHVVPIQRHLTEKIVAYNNESGHRQHSRRHTKTTS